MNTQNINALNESLEILYGERSKSTGVNQHLISVVEQKLLEEISGVSKPKTNYFHIFKVYDYKGGELSTTINLSRKELIEELVDYLNFPSQIEQFIEENDNININTLSKNDEFIKKIDNTLCEYAGGYGHVFEIYESVSDGSIELRSWKDFINEMIAESIDILNDEED